MQTKDLEKCNDERLQERAREGDEAALEMLFQRYRVLINKKANIYYLVGGEKDDLIQEGMIGLFYSIMDYNESKNASFHTFAELCVDRKLKTAVRKYRAQKHEFLNSSISLDGSMDDESKESASFEKLLKDKKVSSPEDEFLFNEQFETIVEDNGKIFSKMEREVLNQYLKGLTYTEIAEVLGKSAKAIDNATQRIKKKVEKILNIS